MRPVAWGADQVLDQGKAPGREPGGGGIGGMPRVSLVVEDALGNRHEKTFRFRVDEYLRLKDE